MICPHCECPSTKHICNNVYRCFDCGTYFKVYTHTTTRTRDEVIAERDADAIDLASNIQPGEEWR